TQAAYEHQDTPFERLVEALEPVRSLNYSPVVQVMLAFQSVSLDDLALPGLQVSRLDLDVPSVRFDLELHVWEVAEGLAGYCAYSTDLFEAATMVRFVGSFQTLLAGIVADPTQGIATLPLLSEAERQQVLGRWSVPAPAAPDTRC